MRYRTWSLLFGYAATSYYLLERPHLLHLKNTKTETLMKEKRVLFAHRGGSIENPENAIQAFKASNKLGVAIETDVRSTKDGHLVICHDDNLRRVCGKDIKVSESNFEELPRTYTEKNIKLEFGHHKYNIRDSDKAEFCTLEELFQTVPKSQIIQIDIKDAADKASCIRVRQLVDQYERADTTIVGTFMRSGMINVREAFSGSQALYLAPAEELLGYVGLYMLGLLPFVRVSNCDVFSLPWMTRDFADHRLIDQGSWSSTIMVHFLPWMNVGIQGMMRNLDKRGIFTCYWVLNNDDEVEHVARRTAARGIMTDRPAAVRQILQKM